MDSLTGHPSTQFLLLSIVAGLGRFAAYILQYGKDTPSTGSETSRLPGILSPSFTGRSLDKVRSYLSHLFGEALFSVRLFPRVFCVSAFIVLGVFWFSDLVSGDFGTATVEPSLALEDRTLLALFSRIFWITIFLLSIIVSNTLFDVVSLTVTRHFLVPFDVQNFSSERRRCLGWRCVFLPIYCIIVYLCFIATMNTVFSIIILMRGQAAGYDIVTSPSQLASIEISVFWKETIPRIIDPIGEGSLVQIGKANLALFCFTPLFPAIILIFAFAIGIVLDAVDLGSGRQLSNKLAVAESRQNKLLAAALTVSVIAGVVGVVWG